MEDDFKKEACLTEVREGLAERRHRVGVELATMAFFTVAIGGIVAAFMNTQRPLSDPISRIALTVLAVGFAYVTIVRIRLSSRGFDCATRRHDKAAKWLRERWDLKLPAEIGRPCVAGRGSAHAYVIAVALAVVYLLWRGIVVGQIVVPMLTVGMLVLAHFLPPLCVESSAEKR